MTKRLNLELSEQTRSKLESLVARSDSGTLTTAVKRALTLYDLVLTHQQNGGEVILRDAAGNEQRLVIL